MDEVVERHQRALDGFGSVAEQVTDWSAQSPCTEWDARGVVEHIIGFHEVLLLRPLGVKANRPREDAVARFRATQTAIIEAISTPEALAEHRDLVSILTTDVLVHTWDLAKAVGLDPHLDTELCALGYERASKARDQFAESDMFSNEVSVPDDADTCAKLLGIMGRDPGWQPS
jgi:uncharacterized protein (TIGR03086 family)